MTEQAPAPDEAPPLTTEEIMSEATIKKAAALAASGVTAVQTLAKKLGISNHFVRKIQADDRFKQLVEEIGNEAVSVSKAALKNEIGKLAPLAVKAIKANLEKNNLQAAITVLRAMGVETAEKDSGEKGGIQIILAGQKPEPKKPDVVVVREDKE